MSRDVYNKLYFFTVIWNPCLDVDLQIFRLHLTMTIFWQIFENFSFYETSQAIDITFVS